MRLRFLLLFLLSSMPLIGQSYLEGDFWLDAWLLGYSPWEREDWVIPQNIGRYSEDEINGELYDLLLEDMRYIMSAALYGWEVTYRPGDSSLGVDEYFHIQLKQEIPWGHPSMKITQSWQEDTRFYIHVIYSMGEHERIRWEAGQSNRFNDSGGRGEASAFGEHPRRTALEDSVKQALRNFLQPRVRNRPRQISGQVYLRDMPYFSVMPHGYSCQSLVKLDLDPLVEYPRGY